MSFWPDLSIVIVQIIVFIWGVITFPFYFIAYRPWTKTAGFKQTRARRIATGNGEVTYRAIDRQSKVKNDFLNHKTPIRTLDAAFDYAFKKFASRRCLGTRQIIRQENETTPEGKVFKKLVLGNYSWLTYNEVAARSEQFGRGLRSLGLQQREKLAVYADTRADWLMAAIGCFKYNFPLVTIYTNLGESGVQYGISQTKAEHVLVSQELLPKLFSILKELPHVTTIIVFEEPHKGDLPDLPEEAKDVKIIKFEDVIELGKTAKVQPSPPQPDDLGIIMYTSGSTGNPKGVMLTHSNLVHCLTSLLDISSHAVGEVRDNDVHIAFLPLAHVLELLAESAYIIIGVAIGYSTPNTLLDTSTAIKRGHKGDATVLKPTLMCAVPVVLDRIYKGINKKVAEQGEFKKKLFDFFVKYRDDWVRRGYDTPIAKALIFKKMRQVVGGNLRMLLSGGAPLSEDAHVFIRTCLCVNVLQGYGLTETGAVACVSDEKDISTGRVGPPLYGVDIKLVDWEDGGYRVTDAVGPRGEIVIGGLHVAKGYYNMPEQTEKDFYDADGKRWFKTGDIGQAMPDGTFKIIDRKKDLVKLQMGEYVSLSKVETAMKLNPIVESVCVCARSTERATVALVTPDQEHLEKIAVTMGKEHLSRSELCNDPAIIKDLVKKLTSFGSSKRLERFEIPKTLLLIDEPWTPESGMVTAALKLKRPAIEAAYKQDIDRLYAIINEEFTDKPKPGSNKVVPV